MSKELNNIRQDIKEKEKEREKYDRQLKQLLNREKKLKRQISQEERKKRTHRLIEWGAILESFIEEAEGKSNEEIKAIIEFKDRKFLWNSVELNEKAINSQLARNFIISLQPSLILEENKRMLFDFIKENFTSRGMIVDLAIHDGSD